MHEVSLCRDLISLVEQTLTEQSENSVKVVKVKLGPFSHVQADALQFCFAAVAEGTVVQNAALQVESLPPFGQCLACGHTQLMRERFDSCELCQSFPLHIDHADDMILQSIEVF